MARWGRDAEDIHLDLAYAFAENLDPIEYLRLKHERDDRDAVGE